MKRFLLSLALPLFTCISTSYAVTAPPEQCPSVNAIKAAPFFMEHDFEWEHGKKFYGASQEDQKYDTNWQGNWRTEVFYIEATSIEDARQQLNLALPALRLKKGPYKNVFGGWDCAYSMGNEFEVFSSTVKA
jgi:hypothetical protein